MLLIFSKKTEVVSKLHSVRSADENVGGSEVDILWKIEVIANCTT